MPIVSIAAVTVAILSIFLFLVLGAALALIIVSLRRPSNGPLLVAGALVAASLVLVTIAPVNVPTFVGLVLGLLGLAVGVIGGDPVTRRVLEVATHGRVRETDDGGILVASPRDRRTDGLAEATEPAHVVLRGGATIGYLERTAAVLAIVAGYPEALAVVVALKGVGRFSELASPEARERFIIGTLASLLWACVVGALVRLAIW